MEQIPAKFLRDSAEVLTLSFRNIINWWIKESTFPEDYTIAKLQPIFKKGTRPYPRNYRPISLLPLVSIMIEKSIHFQITLIKKRIYMYQSGLRANHSADLCLAQLTDFVATGMDKQMHTGMILISRSSESIWYFRSWSSSVMLFMCFNKFARKLLIND